MPTNREIIDNNKSDLLDVYLLLHAAEDERTKRLREKVHFLKSKLTPEEIAHVDKLYRDLKGEKE